MLVRHFRPLDKRRTGVPFVLGSPRLLVTSALGRHDEIVRIDLSSQGAGDLRLGLNRLAARRLLSRWGDCHAFRRWQETNESLVVDRGSTSVFAYFDETDHVNAIEIATPGYGVHAVDKWFSKVLTSSLIRQIRCFKS